MTLSRGDLHDLVPSDDGVSSLIDEHAERNGCSPERSDPDDVAFDEVDDT